MQEKEFEQCQNDLILAKIFELYQLSKWIDIHKDFKWQNIPILSNFTH